MKTLEALTTIERGKDQPTIARGTVFKADDQKQEDELVRLGAVREAPKGAEEGMRTARSDAPSPGAVDDDGIKAAEARVANAVAPLRAAYKTLYGSEAHANMKVDTLRGKVTEKAGDNQDAKDAVQESADAEAALAALTATDDKTGRGGSQAAEARQPGADVI